ncbi:MAG TPA: ATPase, T2SS/T4P/T4SS family, partial [Paracoccaceae bacterium]|nr:ATPase, T2SS/T4P/T4SS family [Paracoccaceae bacterium]
MFKRYRKEAEPSLEAAGAEIDLAPPPAPAAAAPPPAESAAALRAAAPESRQDEPREAKRRHRLLQIKVDLHRRLLETLNLAVIDRVPEADLRREVAAIAREGLREMGVVLNAAEAEQLTQELMDEVTGLGPLEPLLKDDTIADILVNGAHQVFVERGGKLELTTTQFKDDKHLLRVIDKIVSAVGRRVDESQPYVDARLADGSRVNALVPPCAVDGPLLSIRKFSKKPLSIDKLIGHGAFTEEMAAYLQAVVATRLNVVVSGSTGSGKTTTLNALSSFINDKERIVTIEDTAELQLQQTHVGRMESRPPNVEGKGEVSQRVLLKNAL